MNNIKPSFYFTDAVHFNKGSWRSLFLLMEVHAIPHQMNLGNREWHNCLGNYRDKQDALESYLAQLPIDKDALYSFSVNQLHLFSHVAAEMLAFLLPAPAWRARSVPPDLWNIYEMAWELSRNDLRLNMAAGLYWYEYWTQLLPTVRQHTHAIFFSGSKIYARLLLQILTREATKPIVVEHCFTGNEYFFEERFSPLPNSSELALTSVNFSYRASVDAKSSFELRLTASERMKQIKNKNVSQPDPSGSMIRFPTNKPIILIIGQVLNDFSIIETSQENKNSVFIYRKLILEIMMKTEFNIIFKSHPWERSKSHTGGRPITMIELKDLRDSLSFESADRLYLTENHNIYELFGQATYVATLCSQGAIEAAFHGLKPLIFGTAFYGSQGFTHDLGSVSALIEGLQRGIEGTLTIAEYEKLETFLAVAIGLHLVPVREAGVKVLERKLGLVSRKSLQVEEMPFTRERSKFSSDSLLRRRLRKLFRDPKSLLRNARRRLFNIVDTSFTRRRGMVPKRKNA